MATYKHTQKGWIRESGSLMGYPGVEVDSETLQPEGYELGAATADAILDQVGNDPVLAQIALLNEQERDKPRTVLTAKLQRIVDNAES
jgi:hypothetical protein